MKEAYFIGEDDHVVYSTSGSLHDENTTSIPTSGFEYDDHLDFGSNKHIPYGPADDLPVALMKLAEKSTALLPGIQKLASMVYGGGLVFGTLSSDTKGNEIFRIDHSSDDAKKVRDWMRLSQVYHHYVMSAAIDTFKLGWFEVEMLLNKAGDQIAAMYRIPVNHIRWRTPKTKNSLIDGAYVMPDWEGGVDLRNARKVPVINALDHERFEKIKALKQKSFIYRIEFPQITGDPYYPRPLWVSSVLSGWLDYSFKIPEFKRFVMENQMNIKYIIYVDQRYWEHTYPGYNQKSAGEKKSIRQKEVSGFSSAMRGNRNAASAMLASKMATMDGREVKLWEVEELGRNFGKEGKSLYIEDSWEATAQVERSLGMDGVISGSSSGKNQGSGGGSGSNIRTAANLQVSLIRYVQDMIYMPLELARDVNGWGDIVFRSRSYIQQTLDKGSSQQEAG